MIIKRIINSNFEIWSRPRFINPRVPQTSNIEKNLVEYDLYFTYMYTSRVGVDIETKQFICY